MLVLSRKHRREVMLPSNLPALLFRFRISSLQLANFQCDVYFSSNVQVYDSFLYVAIRVSDYFEFAATFFEKSLQGP